MSESPIPEAPESEDPIVQARALRWTASVIAIAALFLLVFNATALCNWSAALKPNDATVQAAAIAQSWEDATAKIDLTWPRAIVHDAWAKGRALTFGPARTGADEPPPE